MIHLRIKIPRGLMGIAIIMASLMFSGFYATYLTFINLLSLVLEYFLFDFMWFSMFCMDESDIKNRQSKDFVVNKSLELRL